MVVVWWRYGDAVVCSVRCQSTCVSKLPSGKMKLCSHSGGHVLNVVVRVCRQGAGSDKDEGAGRGEPVRHGTVRDGGELENVLRKELVSEWLGRGVMNVDSHHETTQRHRKRGREERGMENVTERAGWCLIVGILGS